MQFFFEASHWPSDHMTRSRPFIGQPPLPTLGQGGGGGGGGRGAGGWALGHGGCVVQLAVWLLHNNMYLGFGYVCVHACVYPACIDREASTHTILRVRGSWALNVECQAVCVGENRAHDWQRAVFEGLFERYVLNIASCVWGHPRCMVRQRATNDSLTSRHVWDVDLYCCGPDA